MHLSLFTEEHHSTVLSIRIVKNSTKSLMQSLSSFDITLSYIEIIIIKRYCDAYSCFIRSFIHRLINSNFQENEGLIVNLCVLVG